MRHSSLSSAMAYARRKSFEVHGTYTVYKRGSKFRSVNGIDQSIGAGPPVARYINGRRV